MCEGSKKVQMANGLKKKVEYVCLCETNLKGNEKFVWNGIHGVVEVKDWEYYYVFGVIQGWVLVRKCKNNVGKTEVCVC